MAGPADASVIVPALTIEIVSLLEPAAQSPELVSLFAFALLIASRSVQAPSPAMALSSSEFTTIFAPVAA
jgi:hypothetical protein